MSLEHSKCVLLFLKREGTIYIARLSLSLCIMYTLWEDRDAAVESRDDVSPCIAVALAGRHPAKVRPLHPLIGVHLGGGSSRQGKAMAKARAGTRAMVPWVCAFFFGFFRFFFYGEGRRER